MQSRADERQGKGTGPDPADDEGPGAPCTCCHLGSGDPSAGRREGTRGSNERALTPAGPEVKGQAVLPDLPEPPAPSPLLRAPGRTPPLTPLARSGRGGACLSRPRDGGRGGGRRRSVRGQRRESAPRAALAEGPPPALTCLLTPLRSGSGTTLQPRPTVRLNQAPGGSGGGGGRTGGAGRRPETAPPPRPNPAPPVPGPRPWTAAAAAHWRAAQTHGAAPPRDPPTVLLRLLPSHWACRLPGPELPARPPAAPRPQLAGVRHARALIGGRAPWAPPLESKFR